MSELLELPQSSLAGILVQFMFAYIENAYFSQTWWDSLFPKQQRHIWKLAVMGNPYYARWNYLDGLPIPWEIFRVTDVWDGESEQPSS